MRIKSAINLKISRETSSRFTVVEHVREIGFVERKSESRTLSGLELDALSGILAGIDDGHSGRDASVDGRLGTMQMHDSSLTHVLFQFFVIFRALQNVGNKLGKRFRGLLLFVDNTAECLVFLFSNDIHQNTR